mmetsp:Transcript_30262/g.59097  ORF Transcript_30262/g.59097 Transcript_30262/m.59097 type:complete len:510 (+) Transcript_30262:53-1582(+)
MFDAQTRRLFETSILVLCVLGGGLGSMTLAVGCVYRLVFEGSTAGALEAFVVWLGCACAMVCMLRIGAVSRSKARPKRASVVVLGDLGRSPRMCNHALSLADAGWQVSLVGYEESAPPQRVLSHKNIAVRHISPGWKLPRKPKILYLFMAPFAAISRAGQLGMAMAHGRTKGIVLVQNPPSIPTLVVARALTWLWDGASLVVDWHNFGYTIMETTNAPKPAIAVAKVYERLVGRTADAHFCVTKSMKAFLEEKWGVKAACVLYDKPPASFRRATNEEARDLLMRLETDGVVRCHDFFHDGTCKLRSDRPAMIVSSTSWTPDEDFGVLLKALVTFDAALEQASEATGGASSRAVVIVTGKGPLKQQFEQQIAATGFKRVSVKTAWLRAEDYPVLLGTADLGVCLHYSSSGLDLPMKVVDMFGCELPVCAVRYDCIEELVRHGENGMLFDDAAELSSQLHELLQGFPADQSGLDGMRKHIAAFRERKWEQEWTQQAAPLLARALLPPGAPT